MAVDINYSPEQNDSISTNYEPGRLNVSLTERELEVMKLVAKGRSNEFIAEKLYRSKAAIRSRLKNLYIKLNVDGNKYEKRLKLALLGRGAKGGLT